MLNMDSIYREYAQVVYKFLMSLCYEEDTAEELTQETFYQAVRCADKYDGTCKVTTWLCQIARHLWYQELERRKKKGTAPLTKEIVSEKKSLDEEICICVLLFGAYEMYFEKGRPADFDDVKITYEKTGEVVTIGFLPQNDKIYIDTFVNIQEGEETGISIMKYHVNPIRRPMRIGGYYGVTFADENTILDPGTGEKVKLTGEESLKIKFRDTTKEIKIKDLYTEEGIRKM